MPREYFHIIESDAVHVFELRMPAGTDVSEFDTLNQAALSLFEGRAGDGWVMDMSQFNYIGSAALGFMINVRQRVREAGGALVVCGVSKQILATLRASSLGRLFNIVDTRAEAVAAINQWKQGRKPKPRSM